MKILCNEWGCYIIVSFTDLKTMILFVCKVRPMESFKHLAYEYQENCIILLKHYTSLFLGLKTYSLNILGQTGISVNLHVLQAFSKLQTQ